MPSPQVFAAFAVASLALLIVPGPSVLYIVTRSMDQGRAAGLVSVLGIHTGSIVHVAAAALGLSAILASSAVSFGIVKYAGAAYLVWLGIRAIRGRGEERPDGPRKEHSLARIYAQGVVVNVLNPKTALFFLAFLRSSSTSRRVRAAAGGDPRSHVHPAGVHLGRHLRGGVRAGVSGLRSPTADRGRRGGGCPA